MVVSTRLHPQVYHDVYCTDCQLCRGEMAVDDVPAVWNERMRSDLGLEVPDDASGCLQVLAMPCACDVLTMACACDAMCMRCACAVLAMCLRCACDVRVVWLLRACDMITMPSFATRYHAIVCRISIGLSVRSATSPATRSVRSSLLRSS